MGENKREPVSSKYEAIKRIERIPFRYCFPVILVFIAGWSLGEWIVPLSYTAEVLVLFILTEVIFRNSRIIRLILSLVFLVLYIQAVVLLFSGTYITFIMLTNLASIHMLRGKAIVYATVIIIAAAFYLIPYEGCSERWLKAKPFQFIAVLLFCTVIIAVSGWQYSVYCRTYDVIKTYAIKNKIEKNISKMSETDENLDFKLFFKEDVKNSVNRPEGIPEKPDIVIVFTEGLSQNIVDDKRNIMPNVKAIQQEGINFINYYNHTAATYRGIIGQLYSGHQYNNGDTNALISLQSILAKNSYNTTFTNSEPDNKDFTEYLNQLGFDAVYSGNDDKKPLSDEQTYELIYETLTEGKKTGKPQLVVAYTFGTHVSFDSDGESFGNADDRLLNRFYNADYQFGRFRSNLEKDGTDDNTLIVFTTDHASFVDDDYRKTFPDHTRTDSFCDTIPLTIWGKKIHHDTIDAQGRNSLDLAPTLLDLIDIDNQPNYFLGTSLYQNEEVGLIETVFCVPDSEWMVSTKDSMIQNLNDSDKTEYMDLLQKYVALTRKTDNPIP